MSGTLREYARKFYCCRRHLLAMKALCSSWMLSVASLSVCMSVCVSVTSTERISVEKIQIWLKSGQNVGHFAWRRKYFLF